MNNKLIKISDTHYIIVDDSDLHENDFACIIPAKRISKIDKGWDSNLKLYTVKKITHSTEPLEEQKELGYGNYLLNKDVIKPLSLSEVEEVIYGYSVEKMAENYYNTLGALGTEYDKTTSINLIIWGFKAHQELLKDKLFTVEDMIKFAIDCYNDNYGTDMSFDERAKINIQSLLPKTEWDITFNEQGKIKLI